MGISDELKSLIINWLRLVVLNFRLIKVPHIGEELEANLSRRESTVPTHWNVKSTDNLNKKARVMEVIQ